jgi:shikimate dehydrogenase
MKKFGLIGFPLGHSYSAGYFNAKFEREGRHDFHYSLYPLESAHQIADILRTPDLLGLNVTIPYKETVMDLCDELTAEAKHVGAVNTLGIKDGRIIGHNTDAIGFKLSLRPFLEPKHNKALVLGTGGAAKAVKYVLSELGIPTALVGRNTKGDLDYSQVNDTVVRACKLIVNCTPLGTYPHTDSAPDLPLGSIGTDHFVVDLIYNPERTKLLELCADKGAMVLNGADMLRFQAEHAWQFWQQLHDL